MFSTSSGSLSFSDQPGEQALNFAIIQDLEQCVQHPILVLPTALEIHPSFFIFSQFLHLSTIVFLIYQVTLGLVI